MTIDLYNTHLYVNNKIMINSRKIQFVDYYYKLQLMRICAQYILFKSVSIYRSVCYWSKIGQ